MKSSKINPQKILIIWKECENEFIQYHVIRDKIVSEYGKNITERTIMRYLKTLVNEQKLEKKIEPDHRTYYKPKPFRCEQCGETFLNYGLFHLHKELHDWNSDDNTQKKKMEK